MLEVTPLEMRNGKITVITINIDGKEETLEINPITFQEIDSIKIIIKNYKETESLLTEIRKEYDDVRDRFEPIQKNYKKILISKPENHIIITNPPESSIQEPVIIDTPPPPIQFQEQKPITPDTEALRLIDEVKILDNIFSTSSAFNRNELMQEVAKSVQEPLLEETTTRVLSILEERNLVRNKGDIFTKIRRMIKK